MFSDITLEAAGNGIESTYRLKAVQRPSLLFDTYSYLHVLADPSPNVYNGVTGTGYSIDFEYSIDNVSADTIKLTGIAFNTRMVLVKATQTEAEGYSRGDYESILAAINDYTIHNPWLYLQFRDGNRLQVALNNFFKTFTLSYIDDADQVQLLSSPYYYTLNGIYLEQPFTYKGNTFHELFWDVDRHVFYVTVDGQRVKVQVSPSAVVPMHRLLGIEFDAIIVPPQQLPGWSPLFTTLYQELAQTILTGSFRLTLYYTEFDFDVPQRIMNVNMYVIQNNQLFLAQYPFTYTKTSSGVFNFTQQPFEGNAAAIAGATQTLLGYINNDRFTTDFFIDQQDGNGRLGQLKSVEHPDFFFTGFLE